MRTPEAEHAALDALVHGEGWAIVKELVASAFGPAKQIADIDAIMETLRPGDDERAIVTQIRAAAKAAGHVVTLTEARYKQLHDAAQKTKTPAAPFAGFRRVAR